MTNESEVQALKKSIKGSMQLNRENALNMEAGLVQPCVVCFGKEAPKKVVPTYFFYRKPHVSVDTNNVKRVFGFNTANSEVRVPIVTK